MAEFLIKDEQLVGLKDKVAIVTGGASGIGLATVKLLLSLGAKVVSADINTPAVADGSLFVKTDVSSWSELASLFKKAKAEYGQIDFVFANAGIGPRANYLVLEAAENGDLLEPNATVLDINFKSVINTGALAVHYLKEAGGAIVIMASSTGIQPVRAPDYASAKAGIVGFGRNLARLVESSGLPIRVNTLAPSWTSTEVLPNVAGVMKAVSHESQGPEVVARATALLMADKSRHGELIYISDGKYKEIEKAVLYPAFQGILGDGPSDDEILRRIYALMAGAQ